MQERTTGRGGGCPFSGAGGPPEEGPRGVSRRSVLAGLAGVAALPVLGGGTAMAAPGRGRTRPATSSPSAPPPRPSHAVGNPRGSEVAVRAGRNKEARFGLMFKQLPPFNPPDALLTDLAVRMNDGKPPLEDVSDSDAEFDNPGIPAGYIYLGQFIDHDMTLDQTPLTEQRQDPLATVNYDTPRFDLGSVYGLGPSGSPELYEPGGAGRLRTNDHDSLHDLPRDEHGTAVLGDLRNDENLIVAHLHAAFLRLHNRLMDQGATFEEARRQLRWHFQWLIVHDFLPRIVGQQVVDGLLRRPGNGPIQFVGRFYRPKNPLRPYMPIEYSGAAFRFGHSMIRAEYEMHDDTTLPIFARDGHPDLRGNRSMPADLWMDWNYFFAIPGMDAPDDRNMARKIDTQLSLPLFTLPPTVVAPTHGAIVALAERNLLRGKRLGLPSGQDVATAMGVPPLTMDELGLTDREWRRQGRAPLWYYVLKEAELLGGTRLGPVGGQIVAEVILGLLAHDPGCYFNVQPGFDPGAGYHMGHLLQAADVIDPRAFEDEDDDADELEGEDELEDEEPHEETEEVEDGAVATTG